jgi:hypothetical protein
MTTSKWIATLSAVVAVLAGSGSACPQAPRSLGEPLFHASDGPPPASSTPIPQPTAAQLKAAGLHKRPLAPDSARSQG